jgi:hypothetical protein
MNQPKRASMSFSEVQRPILLAPNTANCYHNITPHIGNFHVNPKPIDDNELVEVSIPKKSKALAILPSNSKLAGVTIVDNNLELKCSSPSKLENLDVVIKYHSLSDVRLEHIDDELVKDHDE